MDLDLKSKIVVITGGTKGIGLAITGAFIAEGAIVHVLARNNDVFFETKFAEELGNRLFFHACDVTKETLLANTLLEVGKLSGNIIDIVVANVGNGRSARAPISDTDQWNAVWDINFHSALYTARVVAPVLKKSGGNIVFISSIAGIENIGAPSDYATAKSALIFFAKSLSSSLAPEVRVNVVAPGNIWVEEGTWGNKLKENPEQVRRMLEEKVPLKRLGLPEEISNAVLFLSSPRSSFTTGGLFVVDGGQTISI